MNNLKQKIATYSAHIGIVGLSYVGLPLSIRFSEAGYKVIGSDSETTKAI